MATEGPGRDGHVAVLLRQSREAAGLTQRGLADELGVARTTIIKAEDGETLPTPEILARLGKPLAIPVLVSLTAHMRDALRNNPDALRQFEEELAESNAYGKASADLLGLHVEDAQFDVHITREGGLTFEQRLVDSTATRALNSLSFWMFTPTAADEVSTSFAVQDSPVNMGWRQDAGIEGGERINRIYFNEPWKPGSSKLTFHNSFTASGVYRTDRDDHDRTAGPRLPPDKWPGKFFIYVKHAIEKMTLRVTLPETVRPIFGPAYSHWDKRPLDVTSAHEIETGRVCKDYVTAQEGSQTVTLEVRRPAPAFSFGVQWTVDDGEEQR